MVVLTQLLWQDLQGQIPYLEVLPLVVAAAAVQKPPTQLPLVLEVLVVALIIFNRVVLYLVKEFLAKEMRVEKRLLAVHRRIPLAAAVAQGLLV